MSSLGYIITARRISDSSNRFDVRFTGSLSCVNITNVMKESKLKKEGFTLIESIIGLGIFALLAAGVASASLLTSRIAISNVYSNTAYSIAQGYAEQIKSISYLEISNALEESGTYSIPCQSLSVAGESSSDPLVFGSRIEKDIVVDQHKNADDSITERTMKMWVTTTGSDLSSTEGIKVIEVTLFFEWQVMDGRSNHVRSGLIKIIKTDVSEY